MKNYYDLVNEFLLSEGKRRLRTIVLMHQHQLKRATGVAESVDKLLDSMREDDFDADVIFEDLMQNIECFNELMQIMDLAEDEKPAVVQKEDYINIKDWIFSKMPITQSRPALDALKKLMRKLESEIVEQQERDRALRHKLEAEKAAQQARELEQQARELEQQEQNKREQEKIQEMIRSTAERRQAAYSKYIRGC